MLPLLSELVDPNAKPKPRAQSPEPRAQSLSLNLSLARIHLSTSRQVLLSQPPTQPLRITTLIANLSLSLSDARSPSSTESP
ncbi:hypothetical protein HYQ45_010988 [Verticillium longisporum]|uniref:Uncharacterized protein n=1 Tax=Verticillium longisporum TaxID=100787 RepID=A0A8I2ZFC8_VERLO|nr:hypothetical protein HYQ45_010988 [Verticillium longisporum]